MADGSGEFRISEGPSQAILSRIRTAARQLELAQFLKSKSGPRPGVKTRTAIHEHEARARRLLLEAEGLARSENEAAWLHAAISETEALALARGEVVDVQPVLGTRTVRKVMLSRGMGLEHARDNGYLAGAHGRDETDDLYETGILYRTAYETIEGLATHKGEGGGGFGPKGPQVRVAEAGQLLGVLRSDLNDRQRKILDAVCGEGLGMFQAATACKMGTPASRNALRGGLVVAMGALRKAKKVNRDGRDLGQDLAAAAEAVDRAGRGL